MKKLTVLLFTNNMAKRDLNIFLLAMINVAAICNIKNFPLTAEYGLSVLFFYAIAAIIFFIPVSLISAELATGWPERGGVYLWVKEAMGPRMGFLAVWLLWSENVIWYPSILSFTAATFAYVFNPAYANHNIYIAFVVFLAFWILTLVNFLGMKISGWISALGVVLGTIVPGALIIIMGLVWFLLGKPIHIPLSWDVAIPNLTTTKELGLLAGLLLTLAGMEMSAVHAKEVRNPQRDYPRAILLSAIIIFVLSSLGGLAIAFVVPQKEINLASGAMEAFQFFLDSYGVPWLMPIIAAVATIGALGMVSTWIVGPSKGLLAAAQDDELPSIFKKMSKTAMPIPLLIVQGVIVSLLSLVFVFVPNVSSSYWMLFNLTALVYLVMYILMFLSGIILRYKKPLVERHYKIPGGNAGMWIVAGIGVVGSLFAFIFGFFPPSQIETGNIYAYEAFLIGGLIIFCVIPFIIYHFYQPGKNKKVLQKPPGS